MAPASSADLTDRSLILGSSSPRRRELIARLGIEPARIAAAEIDETPHKNEQPRPYAVRMAREKAHAIAGDGAFVLAGDTVVALGRRILPKAEDEATARRCLELMSGRRHRVHSAVTVVDATGQARHRLSTTILAFTRLSPAEIAAYAAGGEGLGKAGGYAVQGVAEAFVRTLMGSHSGVMGLPLFETRALLRAAGVLPQ